MTPPHPTLLSTRPSSSPSRPAGSDAGGSGAPRPGNDPATRELPVGAAEDPPAPEVPKISVTQVSASALAAVSTTFALSYLGVAGTIIGAAVASVLTILANHLYTRSILRTRRQMQGALRTVVVRPVARSARTAAARDSAAVTTAVLTTVSSGTGTGTDTGTDTATESATRPLPGLAVTGEIPVVDPASGADEADPAEDEADATVDAPRSEPDDEGGDDEGAADDPRSRWFRFPLSRRALVATTVGLFLAILTAVTVVEVVMGRSISDLVRGEEGSGTSVVRVITREQPAETSEGTGGGTGTQDGTDGTGGSGTDPETGTGTGGAGTEGGGSTRPGETTDPAEPTDPGPADPTDPVEPTPDPTEPTDPTDPTDPVEPEPVPTEPTPAPTDPSTSAPGGSSSGGSGTSGGSGAASGESSGTSSGTTSS
ncbi:hypothetical protein [Oerskovia flava]|uniref:hypothetical protein n=1 Tax=Oerskovia flava TaxID=2986422 RepID=UPI00223EFC25|nr:hypothetical protein [Oerskovia sp. JB1-3-2]